VLGARRKFSINCSFLLVHTEGESIFEAAFFANRFRLAHERRRWP